MNAILFFLLSLAVFLVLNWFAYGHMKRHYLRQLNELQNRYRSLENSHEQCLVSLEQEHTRCSQLAEELDQVTARLRRRETLFRKLLPMGTLTVMDVIRLKKIANDADIQSAKEYIVTSKLLVDVEDVLVERAKLSKNQLGELRDLVQRFLHDEGGEKSGKQAKDGTSTGSGGQRS